MSKPLTPAEKLARKKPKRPANPRHVKLECRLRELRQRAGLTQVEVAAAVGISQGGLSFLENSGEPALTTAIKLSIFYDVAVTEIWKAKGSNNGRKS